MNVVMIGATRGMGRALARLIAESGAGHRMVLLGRGADDLEASAADLRLRAPGVEVHTGPLDLLAPAETFGPALEGAWAQLEGRVDAVVITAGLFGTQEQLEEDSALRSRVLQANFAATVEVCEQARVRLLAQAPVQGVRGTLCVFSSVAGDRGRRTVGLYGATKAGLSHYLESLDHRWRHEGLVTITVKPGFVHTGMTAGLRPPPFAGQPEQVAGLVWQALQRGTPMVYAPGIWAWVMAVIRRLPRAVMRRVKF
jgi:short-subunit dehydrogenase